MKSNAYFEEMRQELDAWEERRDAHRALRREITDKYGYDSPEYDEWYDNKPVCPYESGACKAYQAFLYSMDELVMGDFLWDREVADFVGTLRKAGIQSFILTTKSSALMENLHWLADEGCEIAGLVKIERPGRWHDDETTMGIRISLSTGAAGSTTEQESKPAPEGGAPQ